MTKLVVNTGGCGYTIDIRVEKAAAGQYSLTVETGCEHVKALAGDLPVLKEMDVFIPILQNPVYQAAARRVKHSACPIPSAILKTLEVEAGFNVARDVTFTFER